MLESGGMNGRASASASKANNKQRAAINNRSSHSILRRRTEMVSNRKRMAPHSMGFAACLRTRWMMIGIAAATRPARSHGLRNNIYAGLLEGLAAGWSMPVGFSIRSRGHLNSRYLVRPELSARGSVASSASRFRLVSFGHQKLFIPRAIHCLRKRAKTRKKAALSGTVN